MPVELLSTAEMAECDRRTIAVGDVDGYGLMRRAGAAVADIVLDRFPDAVGVDVLCGPGNNGGDGTVVAALLKATGIDVKIFRDHPARAGTDAARAARDCPLTAQPLQNFSPRKGRLVVDALYGAGLSKPLSGAAARVAELCDRTGARVVAVDVPSGVSGATGLTDGSHFRADVTVTFARRKPGHLLLPGRAACGEVVVADIGIPNAIVDAIGSRCMLNEPGAWRQAVRGPALDTHKYARGHALVFSGGMLSSGAARLSAMAAARAGAGAVTLMAPDDALAVNATHLTSIMLEPLGTMAALDRFLEQRKVASAVIGPGFGVGPVLRALVLRLLARTGSGLLGDGVLDGGVVLDADAITVFAETPAPLFEAVCAQAVPATVMTPHDGEFRRLFPDLAADKTLSKLDRARAAARRSGTIVVSKGPDTVIAAPDGRAAINENGTPWLATAGSGDVLAGIMGGLLAQRVPAFEAACAAVWLHAEAARRFGAGLIAEDLPTALVPVLQRLQHGGA